MCPIHWFGQNDRLTDCLVDGDVKLLDVTLSYETNLRHCLKRVEKGAWEELLLRSEVRIALMFAPVTKLVFMGKLNLQQSRSPAASRSNPAYLAVTGVIVSPW